MDERKIRVIINPASGLDRRKRSLIAVLKPVLPGQSDIVFTKKKGDGVRLSAEAVKNGFDTVVAVGGDGSINECARALVNTDVALGIIPAGSGNGLARCMQIPFRIDNAVKCVLDFKIQTIDAVRINKEWAFSIAGFGLDARIAKLYAREKQRGFYPYLKLTLQEYLNYDPIYFKLKNDGKKISGKALFVSIANSNQFGYNTVIANNAKIDDGLLDVCIFYKVPLLKIPVIAPFLFLHKLDYSGYMDSFQTREFEVTYRKGHLMNIDGEAVRMKRKLKVTLHPAVLKVIVP
jgi:YegS/Rv2252/BmrU family lipid kinase